MALIFFNFKSAWYFKGKELCFGRDERNVPMEGEQCAGISELIQHPNYDRSETVLNDICLIRLSKKLEYSQTVQIREKLMI